MDIHAGNPPVFRFRFTANFAGVLGFIFLWDRLLAVSTPLQQLVQAHLLRPTPEGTLLLQTYLQDDPYSDLAAPLHDVCATLETARGSQATAQVEAVQHSPFWLLWR